MKQNRESLSNGAVGTDAIGGKSGFSDVDKTYDPRKYLGVLDQTSATNLWQGIKRAMLLQLALKEGDCVLDVGCGTGNDVRILAPLVGRSGRAVGIDRSATMVAEAQERSRQQKLPSEFYLQDVSHLQFPDGTFDGCRIERVLQHLDSPRAALKEIARVMRSGSRIVVAEPDYGSLVIEGADEGLTRKIIDCRISHFKSGRVGLQLPLLLRQVGFENVTIEIVKAVTVDYGTETSYDLCGKLAEAALTEGLISQSQAWEWLNQLQTAGHENRFLHSVMVFLVSARKPTSHQTRFEERTP